MHPTLMKKFLKLTLLISLAVLFSFVTYQICYWTAERYFFDKFFYKKSVQHGYFLCDKEGCSLEKYGRRSKDLKKILVGLDTLSFDLNKLDTRVLGEAVKDTFTIAILGDSYVWGVGVKNEERFPVILEKKLNENEAIKKPVEVLSFGASGDNILEHLSKYESIENFLNLGVDLYIIVIVDNDIFLREDRRYIINQAAEEIIQECSSEGEYVYNRDAVMEKLNLSYFEWLKKAWKAPANLCLFKNTITEFPQNTIYFEPKDYWTNFEQIVDFLEEEGGFVITSKKGKNMEKYKKYWNDPIKNFFVSEKESHPSKLAHQMYADILYQEIITNPRWGGIYKEFTPAH